MQGDLGSLAQALVPTALVDRLSAAAAGSRELDAAIWLRFNRPEYTGDVKALEMRGWYDGRGHLILETDAGEEVADDLWIGNYTTSLDAALALGERALNELLALCLLEDVAQSALDYGGVSTKDLPRLLCIAILKAVAAQSPTEQVGIGAADEPNNPTGDHHAR